MLSLPSGGETRGVNTMNVGLPGTKEGEGASAWVLRRPLRNVQYCQTDAIEGERRMGMSQEKQGSVSFERRPERIASSPEQLYEKGLRPQQRDGQTPPPQ